MESEPAPQARWARFPPRGDCAAGYNTTRAPGLFAGGAIGGWLTQHFGEASVFVFGFAVIALWLGVASGMRIAGNSAERTCPARAGGDAVALREKLVRLRGVREAVVVPEEGIARLTVYPESFDERAATEIIGGES